MSHPALGGKEGGGRGAAGCRAQAACLKGCSEGEVGAAVTTTVAAAAAWRLSPSAGLCSQSARSDPLSPRPAPPVGAGCARAQSVGGVRGLPAPARARRRPAGTHRKAGPAGRGRPGAQVSPAAEWDVLRPPRGRNLGLRRARERRAGQEAGGRAASDRPHDPRHLPPLRPPAVPPGTPRRHLVAAGCRSGGSALRSRAFL